MKSKLITIGIITKGLGHFVKESITSAFNQSLPPFEVIVINDSPTPESTAFFRSLENDLLRYIQINETGRPAARNAAIAALRSPYLLWLDDDDVLLPHAVRSVSTTLENYPKADVIYSNLLLCNEKLDFLSYIKYEPLKPQKQVMQFFRDVVVPNPGTTISKSCFERIGGYDAFFERGQDYDFFARAASNGAMFIHNDCYICLYRAHSKNAATHKQRKDSYKFATAVMRKLLKQHGIQKICPDNDWQKNPEVALYNASIDVATRFLTRRAYDEAKSVLQISATQTYLKSIQAFIGIINAFETQTPLDLLDSAPKQDIFNNNITSAHLSEHLFNTLCKYCTDSLQDANNIKKAYLSKKLTLMTIEEMYPQFDWATYPKNSMHAALSALCDSFIQCNGLTEALEVLGYLDNTPTIDFLKNVIKTYQQHGYEGLTTLKKHPLYYSFGTQQLICQISTLHHQLKTQQQEENICTKIITEEAHINSLDFAPIDYDSFNNPSWPLLDEAARIATNTHCEYTSGDAQLIRQYSTQHLTPINISDPIYSIILTVENEEQYLHDCLLSLVTQGDCSFEVILATNTQRALKVINNIDKFSQYPFPITIVSSEADIIQPCLINDAANIAKGKHLVFLTDRMILTLGFLDSLSPNKDLNEYVILIPSTIQNLTNGIPLSISQESFIKKPITTIVLGRLLSSAVGGLIISHLSFNKLGGYRETLDLCTADIDLAMRSSLALSKVQLTNNSLLSGNKLLIKKESNKPDPTEISEKRLIELFYCLSLLTATLDPADNSITSIRPTIVSDFISRGYPRARAVKLLNEWWIALEKYGNSKLLTSERTIAAQFGLLNL